MKRKYHKSSFGTSSIERTYLKKILAMKLGNRKNKQIDVLPPFEEFMNQYVVSKKEAKAVVIV